MLGTMMATFYSGENGSLLDQHWQLSRIFLNSPQAGPIINVKLMIFCGQTMEEEVCFT
jgi:hypothetical protein